MVKPGNAAGFGQPKMVLISGLICDTRKAPETAPAPSGSGCGVRQDPARQRQFSDGRSNIATRRSAGIWIASLRDAADEHRPGQRQYWRVEMERGEERHGDEGDIEQHRREGGQRRKRLMVLRMPPASTTSGTYERCRGKVMRVSWMVSSDLPASALKPGAEIQTSSGATDGNDLGQDQNPRDTTIYARPISRRFWSPPVLYPQNGTERLAKSAFGETSGAAGWRR